MTKLLETRDLRTNFYTYEGVVKALNGVSMVVDHGSTLGLVGESGCGKSVFVRSIMRIVQEPGKVEGGKVVFFPDKDRAEAGIDLLEQSEAFMENLRGDQISMIFQEPNSALNPTMTIGTQIGESFLFHQKKKICAEVLAELESPSDRTFPPLKRYLVAIYRAAAKEPDSFFLRILDGLPILRGWKKRLLKEIKSRSIDILGRLGIPNPERVIDLYPHNLSGGMKQRIVIAIALACNPQLLIADEATSNLDVTIQAQILDLLRRLKKEYISSILLITHDLGVAAETCDRVGVMYAGNLCETSPVDELFNNPIHPYTKALLAAAPKFSMEGKLQPIEGSVPNLVSPPAGCRFHPRCPLAMDVCRRELPAMIELTPDHFAACHAAAPA